MLGICGSFSNCAEEYVYVRSGIMDLEVEISGPYSMCMCIYIYVCVCDIYK